MAKQLDARVVRFGRRIKALREATQGLSQEALALAVGYSRSAIANLETGRLDPVLGRAFVLAEYFNRPLAQLLSDSEQDEQPRIPSERQACLDLLDQLGDNMVVLCRRHAEALRQFRVIDDIQISIEHQACLDLLGQLGDNMVVLCRRHAEALRQFRVIDDVQISISPEHQAFLDLLGQLDDNSTHLLRRYAEALRQGETRVADDLDRQLTYIEDALKFRRFQQAEREGDGTESAPAG